MAVLALSSGEGGVAVLVSPVSTVPGSALHPGAPEGKAMVLPGARLALVLTRGCAEKPQGHSWAWWGEASMTARGLCRE